MTLEVEEWERPRRSDQVRSLEREVCGEKEKVEQPEKEREGGGGEQEALCWEEVCVRGCVDVEGEKLVKRREEEREGSRQRERERERWRRGRTRRGMKEKKRTKTRRKERRGRRVVGEQASASVSGEKVIGR